MSDLKQAFKDVILDIRNFGHQVEFKVGEFWDKNAYWIKPAIPVVAPIVLVIIKQAKTDHNHRKEQELKDLYIYDRSAGHYWPLCRKPKASEWVEIDSRKAAGEDYYVILTDMKLLR